MSWLRSKVSTIEGKGRGMHLQERQRRDGTPLGWHKEVACINMHLYSTQKSLSHWLRIQVLPYDMGSLKSQLPALSNHTPKLPPASLLAVSCPLLHHSHSPPALVDSQFLWGGSKAEVCPATAPWLGNCAAAPILLHRLSWVAGNCET